MENQELYEKLKDDYHDGFEAVIENLREIVISSNQKILEKMDKIESKMSEMICIMEELVG